MEELELGLSLCPKKAAPLSDKGSRPWNWEKHCRILTAKDFPMVPMPATSLSSSSSVSSSSISGKHNSDGLYVSEKRDSVSSASHGLVGWPPVRAFRINNMSSQYKDNMYEANTSGQKKKIHNSKWEQKGNESKELKVRESNEGCRFIKANMDGDPIGRKVDLNAHESYETLAFALENMFYRPCLPYDGKVSLFDGSNEFALTYEDKDGDWMLLGDVPWSMFLETAKRLRIMRITEASGQKLRLSISNESGVQPT